MASPIGLRDDGEHLALTRTKGGGWASDDTEVICRLDRLQVANLIADAEEWLTRKWREAIRPGHEFDHLECPGRASAFVVCKCGARIWGNHDADGQHTLDESGARAAWYRHATGAAPHATDMVRSSSE